MARSDHRDLSRRDFLRLQLGGAAWLALGGLPGCRRPLRDTGTRVIALGLDGLDPNLVARMMKQGELPTFARLAREGTFGPLGTSDPPQSPVAWANFITGQNPGKHGIFDFVHRDPDTLFPYLSTSRSTQPARTTTIGDIVIPLSSGKVENLRRGRALWDILEERGIPATVFKVPSNFPPSSSKQRTISGMGTPDILGTYGMFSYYTDQPFTLDETLGGGTVHRVSVDGHAVSAALVGPPNTFRKGSPETRVPFTVHRDPEHRTAKLSVQGHELILEQGQWSPWVQVSFEMLATLDVKGICRFYLKEAHPHFKLYVTPINIDPRDPSMPISTPESYSREIARKVGPFHTKGLPADTKALDQGVLDDGEFLAQDDIFLEEKLAIYEHELARFDAGLLFYYISSTDQRAHMFWRLRDPHHPAYDDRAAARWGQAIEHVYRRMDRLLEKTLEKVDERTLLVAFSDHGFAPYYRSFNLNSWLRDQGYLVTTGAGSKKDEDIFSSVDWSRTRAYAMGFNSLYVNQKGRESRGSVSSKDTPGLVDEIAARLTQATDPESDERPVIRARKTRTCYSGAQTSSAPDIIVGYNRGYRASWQTALGVIPEGWFSTNEHKWSGDHCMDASIVPGSFFINRKARAAKPTLCDMTATILDAFDVPVPEDMDGKTIL
jgi:predicted AlkP superfamily phosphohydrolase/phosphomutase